MKETDALQNVPFGMPTFPDSGSNRLNQIHALVMNSVIKVWNCLLVFIILQSDVYRKPLKAFLTRLRSISWVFEPNWRFLMGFFYLWRVEVGEEKRWQSLSQHCSIRACHSSCSAVFRQIPGWRKPKFFVAASSSRTDGWWWCKIGPFQLETEKTVKVIACWRKRTTAAF